MFQNKRHIDWTTLSSRLLKLPVIVIYVKKSCIKRLKLKKLNGNTLVF